MQAFEPFNGVGMVGRALFRTLWSVEMLAAIAKRYLP